MKTAVIFGGTGFIGRSVVKRLASAGWQLRIATRNPARVKALKPAGSVGQIEAVRAPLHNAEAVSQAVKGADLVINLVGILFESGKQKFDGLHTTGAETIAKAAFDANVGQLIHMSALGVDQPSGSSYAASKLAGEQTVQSAFPKAVILRPSLVIGPDDGFFNRFGQMAVMSPFLPLVDGGKAKFQPLTVTDLADFIEGCTQEPLTQGQIFELGGPTVYSFKQMLELLLKMIERKRMLLPLPMPIAKLQASVLQLLPNPPLTPDQLKLLSVDNVLSGDFPGLEAQGLEASPIEGILATYIDAYKPGKGNPLYARSR